MEVEFEYIHAVHSPFHLKGHKGHSRRLKMEDALMLAEQGYGRITNLHPAGVGGPPAAAGPEKEIETVDEVPKRVKRKRKKSIVQSEGEENDNGKQPEAEDAGTKNVGSD